MKFVEISVLELCVVSTLLLLSYLPVCPSIIFLFSTITYKFRMLIHVTLIHVYPQANCQCLYLLVQEACVASSLDTEKEASSFFSFDNLKLSLFCSFFFPFVLF